MAKTTVEQLAEAQARCGKLEAELEDEQRQAKKYKRQAAELDRKVSRLEHEVSRLKRS